jgi:hypothetical protein
MFDPRLEPSCLTELGVSPALILATIRKCGTGRAVEQRFQPTTHYLSYLAHSSGVSEVTGPAPDINDETVVRWVEFVAASCESVDMLAALQRDDIIIGVALVAGRLFHAMLLSGGEMKYRAYAHLLREVVQFLCSEFRIESEDQYLRFVIGGCIAWFHGFIPDTTEMGRQVIAALLLFENLFS